MTPLLKVIICLFIYANAEKFTARCSFWVIVMGCVYGLTDAIGIAIPSLIIQALLAATALAHAPLLNRRTANLFIIAVLLLVAGVATEQVENVQVFFLFTAVVLSLRRLVFTLCTLRASTPTPLIFPIVSHILPQYSFNEKQFFRTDNPPEEVALKREAAFAELKKKWDAKFPKSLEFSSFLRDSFSDLRFASSNRVFIPFKSITRVV